MITLSPPLHDEHEELDTTIESFFAAEGLISKHLSKIGRPYRATDEQMQYSKTAYRALADHDGDRGHVVFLEGETGLGKTMGYTVPALLRALKAEIRGVVAIPTIQLVDQYIQGDLALASEIISEKFGRDISVAPFLGRQNFPSPERIASLLGDPGRVWGATERKYLEGLLDWDSLIDHYLQMRGPLPGSLTAHDVSLGYGALSKTSEAYENHRERAEKADIIVCTHISLLLHASSWFRCLPGDEIDFAIIDEADQLPNAAQSIIGKRVSAQMLRRHSALLAGHGARFAGLDKAIKLYETWSEEIREKLLDRHLIFPAADGGDCAALNHSNTQEVQQQAREYAGVFLGYLQKASKVVRKIDDPDIAQSHAEMIVCLEQVTRANPVNGSSATIPIIKWSPIQKIPSLSNRARFPGRVLNRLWSPIDQREPRFSTTICTSATLKSSENASDWDLKRHLGVYHQTGFVRSEFHRFREDLSQSYSPKRFGSLSFILASPDIPPPHVPESRSYNDQWLSYARQCLEYLLEMEKRTLILTSSYRDIGELLPNPPEGLLIDDTRTRLSELIRQFGAKRVLVSPNAWQGVDTALPIELIIIPKVPYPPPNQETIAIDRASGLSERDASRLALMEMKAFGKRKLRQGIGRALRSPDQSATIAILDPRFPRPGDKGTPGEFSHLDLRNTIPMRFRDGSLRPPYRNAQVLAF